VSNELLSEDVYVSWHDHRARRHTTAYMYRPGTPNCGPEARGLRQGPRAGGQDKEVGERPNLHDFKRGERKAASAPKHCWRKRTRRASSLYMYIPSSPNNIVISSNLFIMKPTSPERNPDNRSKRLLATMETIPNSHLRSPATPTRQSSQQQPSSSPQQAPPSQQQASEAYSTAQPSLYAHI
jgi:hypothetical protein